MRWIVLAFCCALLLAGCLGVGQDPQESSEDPTAGDDAIEQADTQPAEDSPSSPASQADQTAAVPTWTIGDWWTYRVEGAGDPSEITFAVARAGNGTYQLLADARQHTVFDATFSDLPYLGPIRAEDLSGTQDGERVQLFTWPLEDGATWTTTWNFDERTVEAEAAPVPVPDGEAAGFEMTATSEGDTFATYTYAPSVGWFTRLELTQLGIGYELVAHGTGFDGEVLSAEAEEVYAAPDRPVDAARFPVEEDADVVALEAAGGGDLHAQAIRLLAPNGTVYEGTTAPCQECFETHRVLAPAAEGEWILAHVATEGAGQSDGFAWAQAATVALHELAIPPAEA